MAAIEAYKIRNEKGEFSTGGEDPRWTSRGKTWGSKRAIMCHLGYFCVKEKYNPDTFKREKGWWNKIPENWTVIKLSDQGLEEIPAKSMKPETSGFTNGKK